VIHHGERLPFEVKPRHHGACVHPDLDQLQGDPAANRDLLLRQVHGSASSFAENLDKFVRADSAPCAFSKRNGGHLERGIRIGCGSVSRQL
jgi:hypothetical protein